MPPNTLDRLLYDCHMGKQDSEAWVFVLILIAIGFTGILVFGFGGGDCSLVKQGDQSTYQCENP